MRNKMYIGFWIICNLWLRDGEVKRQQKKIFYSAWTPHEKEKEMQTKKKPNKKNNRGWRNDKNTVPQNPKTKKTNLRKRRF
jgi:hypothetical protein